MLRPWRTLTFRGGVCVGVLRSALVTLAYFQGALEELVPGTKSARVHTAKSTTRREGRS